MDKAIEEINKRIEMWEERLEEEKKNAINHINNIRTSGMGITRYSEEITRIMAKIEVYREAILIMEHCKEK